MSDMNQEVSSRDLISYAISLIIVLIRGSEYDVEHRSIP